MSKKLYFVIAVLIVLSLAACSRSASTSPVATATQRVQDTNNTLSPASNATQDPMAMVKLFATQTAMASGAGTPLATSATQPTSGTPGATSGATSIVPPTITPGATAVATPYPTLSRPTTYTLQTGEYPYCIARRYNLDPAELLDLNNLSENELLQAGAVLNIPQTGNTFPGPRARVAHPATYVVKADDTIYRIACYYGDVDPLAIAAVNHLVAPYTLTVGQTISIP